MTPTRTLIPRALLFGNPTRSNPQISPDGHHLSFIAPLDGVLNIWVAPIDDLANAVPVTRDRKRGIRFQFWPHLASHLCYLQDEDGDENHHLFSVPAAGGDPRDLTPFGQVQARLVGLSRRRRREALVASNHRDPRWHDVFRIDLATGDAELVEENHGFAGYLADDELRPRLAIKTTPDGGEDVMVPTSGGWHCLFHVGHEDAMGTQAVAFGPSDGSTAYFIDSRGRNTAAAVALDVGTGLTTLLGEDPRADISALAVNPHSRRVEAYRTHYLEPEWQVLDASVEADYRALEGLGLGTWDIVSRCDDDRLWVVMFRGDRKPASFYIHDRNERSTSFLYSARPELERWPSVRTHPTVIRARDGLDLVSYLALPADAAAETDAKPRQPVPMVLLVHGGPWARDDPAYDPLRQFLADRGYAVLSVNFRGSDGFGKAFVNAGDREWGGRMHDDLIDAVDWAVRQGFARADRIAIMGMSYGGYAALAGLTFTPDVFACGVDVVGPSNLETLLATVPPYWTSMFDMLARRVADPRTEEGRALLRERSPLNRADRIVRPLLVVQGANDPRVKRAEADQIVDAAIHNGQPVTYLLYPDEGHVIARPENRLSFMAIVERFLATALGGACEEFGNDLRGGSLEVLAGAEQIPELSGLECPSGPAAGPGPVDGSGEALPEGGG